MSFFTKIFTLCLAAIVNINAHSNEYYREYENSGYLGVLQSVKESKVDINSVNLESLSFISHYFLYEDSIDESVIHQFEELGGVYQNEDKYLIGISQKQNIEKIEYLLNKGYKPETSLDENSTNNCFTYAVRYGNDHLLSILIETTKSKKLMEQLLVDSHNKIKGLSTLLNNLKEMEGK